MISPIDETQQQTVIEHTERYIALASQEFSRRFQFVPVDFDLPGASAGMFRVKGRESRIRYNPWLFAKFFAENLTGTVPHEVAHYIVHCLYGLHRVKPHGREWQAVMAVFEADPSVTGDFDLEGIPQRRQRRFSYRCACRQHEISTRRHNTMQGGRGRYECRLCNGELRYVDS